jgi:hypothetical protein
MSMEIAIHRSLAHQHVVGFHGFFEDSDFVFVVLELCRRRVSWTHRSCSGLGLGRSDQGWSSLGRAARAMELRGKGCWVARATLVKGACHSGLLGWDSGLVGPQSLCY